MDIHSKLQSLFSCIAGFLTTPLDVAKTKLMTQRDGYYKNIGDTLVKIWTEEGPLKLYSASHIRAFNLSIGGIIFFGSYEYFKKWFLAGIETHWSDMLLLYIVWCVIW